METPWPRRVSIGLTDEDPLPIGNGPDDPCYCKSGRLFWDCCGTVEEPREPPVGVVLVPDFVSEDFAASLIERADFAGGEALGVVDLGVDPELKERIVRPNARRAERVQFEGLDAELRRALEGLFVEGIPAMFGREVDWYEPLKMFRYYEGGHHGCHADSDAIDPQLDDWRRVHDRDVSMLLYLGGDFDGGEISFPLFNYTLHPRPGTLLVFPSDSRFEHEVARVTRGVRYVVVGWAAVRGVAKVKAQPPPGSVLVPPANH